VTGGEGLGRRARAVSGGIFTTGAGLWASARLASKAWCARLRWGVTVVGVG